MFKIIRERWRQGMRTIEYPAGEAPVLPDRFRGLPVVDASKCPAGCAECAKACPTDAITHGHGFEVASYNTSTMIKRKEDMLAPMPPGADGRIQTATEEPAKH